LTKEQLRGEIESAKNKSKAFPAGAPVLLLGGNIDYSLPFKYEKYPAELIEAWNAEEPNLPIHIATFGEYADAVLPAVRSNKYDVTVVTSGSKRYDYSAFWVNAPYYKQWYRRSEHRLQSAETLATIASLDGQMQYPSQDFANSWFLMSLNMDRNLLWGVGVDGTFNDANSWDARDRFEYVEQACSRANDKAMSTLAVKDTASIALFNPVNWVRKEPFEIRLNEGQIPAEQTCQLLEDGGGVLVQAPLSPVSVSSMKLKRAALEPAVKTTLAERIETNYYSAKIEPGGALVSLKLKSSGREILAGPANVVIAESKGNPHWVPQKAKRDIVATYIDYESNITVTKGKLATVVEIQSGFYGDGELVRIMRFYHNSRRIDFITETNNVPAGTVLSVEFPLADQITEIRRGIPYGFSHGAWPEKNATLKGITKGIIPVIRCSDYSLQGGGGVALLDRGLPARELVGNTPILLLHNVCDTYYNRRVTWMNHTGPTSKQRYEYALVVREQPWDEARIPQMAWEYNCPVVTAAGQSVEASRSFIETSDNIIVQALRRGGSEIEVRLVECMGESDKARIKLGLPHSAAAMTDLLGRHRRKLKGRGEYTFDVRPQQIVTLRFRTKGAVASAKALRSFDSVIPEHKREYMRSSRDPNLIGHPPRQ